MLSNPRLSMSSHSIWPFKIKLILDHGVKYNNYYDNWSYICCVMISEKSIGRVSEFQNFKWNTVSGYSLKTHNTYCDNVQCI